MSTLSSRRSHSPRRTGALLGAAVLVFSLGTLPAVAGHDDDDEGYDGRSRRHAHGPSCGHDGYAYGHDRDHDRHRGHGHRGYHDHDRFVVPTVIRHTTIEVYEPYYRGHAYYAPHRHEHAVYDFPVQVEHGYAYEPHAYCRGTLFRHQVAYAGPRLRLSLGF